MTVFPALSSSSMIKSTEISLQGAEGLTTAYKRPDIFPCLHFAAAQVGQLATQLAMSFFRDGHQNCLFTRWRVFMIPKFPASFESWQSCMNFNLWVVGMYNFPPPTAVHFALSRDFVAKEPLILFQSLSEFGACCAIQGRQVLCLHPCGDWGS